MKYPTIPHFILLFFVLALSVTIDGQTSFSLDSAFAPVVENFPVTVTLVAKQPDGKILVGGIFTIANGTQKYDLVRYNSEGILDTTFNASISTFGFGIRTIAIQSDGKILVGGNLFNVNNGTTTGILRLNANGSFDTSFSGRTSSTVYSIVILPNGNIVAGGAFTTANGVPNAGLVRFNSNGSVNAGFPQSNGTVRSIAIQPDGKLIVAGSFTTLGTASVPRIARLETTGAIDATFAPVGGANARINAVSITSNGNILIGGIFSVVNGLTRSVLARLDSAGNLDTSFNPSISYFAGQPSVETIAVRDDGKICIGGTFNLINGSSRFNVARLNTDSTIDGSFTHTTGADGVVNSIAIDTNEKLIIGGAFTHYDNSLVFRFSRLNNDGSQDLGFQTSINWNGDARAIKIQPDGKFVVAGNFFWVDGVAFGGIIRFMPDGTLDPTFLTGIQTQLFSSPLEDIEILPNGKIIIVGAINVGSDPTTYAVVRLNSDGSYDNTFIPVPIGDNAPNVIKTQANGQVIVSGPFTQIANASRKGIARFNANGSLDTTFIPTYTTSNFPSVSDIEIRSDGKILIGGTFAAADGSSNNNIALVNQDGSLDSLFPTNASNSVSEIYQFPDGSFIIAGSFNSISGTPRNRIAKLQANGQLDNSFNVDPSFQFPTSVIKPYIDGRIILAGNGFVVLNSTGSLYSNLPQNLTFNASIYDIAVQNNGKVLVGGSFLRSGNQLRYGLARLNGIDSIRKPIFDYDGDGKTDISIFRPAPGEWWINRSTNGSTTAFQFGNSTDRIVPADFTGDGKTDVTFWRPSTGFWFVLRSEDNSFFSFPFGTNGDIPVPADYDGDGKADAAVFRPSTLTWFISKSSGGTDFIGFGAAGDKPTVADYDGDGKVDIAIFRPIGAGGESASEWWIRRSSTGVVFALQFGTSTDKPVQADFTGDGKADIAFWRPSNGFWFVLRSEDNSFFSFPFGTTGDVPVPGDYDADGKSDAAVYRPSNFNWFIQRSTAGTLIQQFGIANDIPTPSAFSQ